MSLEGKTFGDLTVLSRAPNAGRRTTWLCRCVCGNETKVISYNLTRGTTTSCGCKKTRRGGRYNFIDLTGKVFGQLRVLSLSEDRTKTRGAIWVCICECGRTTKLSSHALTSGNNSTCGDHNTHGASERIGDIPLSHLNAIRQNATKRQHPFWVSGEYLWELFQKQNKKCALSGVPLEFTPDKNASAGKSKTTASLDRIENAFGYIPGNVRWVHKDLNKMRLDHSDAEFLEWCWRCITHNVPVGPNRWDLRYLQMARFVSSFSKDPSTKTGAVIVAPNKSVVSMGYNGFAQGVDDSDERLNNRELKYKLVVHCERNAIIFAQRDLSGCTLYTWPFMSCAPCAGMVIQAGITRVVAPQNDNPRWVADFELSRQMFNEAKVQVDFLGSTS